MCSAGGEGGFAELLLRVDMPAWCDELVQWDDELKRETDHITLGLVEPWPKTLELPEGVELLTLRTHLRMGQDALVRARQALSGLQYAFATFAGCEAFRSIPEFAEAVAEILEGTPAVKLYHNRTPLSDLLELFPNAQRIVLNHDLSDSEEIFLCSRGEGVEPHPLTHLEGNLGDHEDTGLALYGQTVNDLLACCPNVSVWSWLIGYQCWEQRATSDVINSDVSPFSVLQ